MNMRALFFVVPTAILALALGVGIVRIRQPAPTPQVITPSFAASRVTPMVPPALATGVPAPQATITALPSPVTIAGSPVPTTVPPVSVVDFPAQTIAYPSGWPADLRLPDAFLLVDAYAGIFLDGQTKVWSTKRRYKGDKEAATQALSAFFQGHGWTIERLDGRSGTTTSGIRRNDGKQVGSYVCNIDPDDSNYIRIIGAVRL